MVIIEMLQIETLRFTPGLLYRPVYNVLLHEQVNRQSIARVKCLKERDGKYLFQRADGLQYWLSHEDAGYLLDDEPCTDEEL